MTNEEYAAQQCAEKDIEIERLREDCQCAASAWQEERAAYEVLKHKADKLYVAAKKYISERSSIRDLKEAIIFYEKSMPGPAGSIAGRKKFSKLSHAEREALLLVIDFVSTNIDSMSIDRSFYDNALHVLNVLWKNSSF